MKLLKDIFRWILGKAVLLLLLIGLLVLAPPVKELIEVLANFSPETHAQHYLDELKTLIPDEEDEGGKRDRKLRELEEHLANKKQQLEELARVRCILPTCGLVLDAKRYNLTIEIALLEQSIVYSKDASGKVRVCDRWRKNRQKLVGLQVIEEQLEADRCGYCLRTDEHKQLLDQIEGLKAQIHSGARLCRGAKLTRLGIETAIETADSQFLGQKKYLLSLQNEKDDLVRNAGLVLPTALLTLLGIILLPIVVKLTAYYTIAPWASRREGSRLLPECAGTLSIGARKAMHDIQLDADHELLIRPSLVAAKSEFTVSDAELVLDWSMPLSSIATGLYSLQRVRTNSAATVGIATPDGVTGVNKLVLLTLPENTALVLHPRCLVGVVQPVAKPVRITRHWQLGYLSSWLSGRLRHVVFHGPAQLILRGRGGVMITEVNGSEMLKRPFMLGYSANISYGVSRSTPLLAYLKSENELFDDRFFGDSGYYILEVSPKPPSSFGPTRWIEAVIKSIFNLFGV